MLSNPKSGISIVGLCVGTQQDTNQSNYTNYRLGVLVESKPDNYGVVSSSTLEIELTKIQYENASMIINQNLKKPVRVWVDIDHRAGEKNGRVWEMLRLRMRPDSQIEFLEGIANHLISDNKTEIQTKKSA